MNNISQLIYLLGGTGAVAEKLKIKPEYQETMDVRPSR